MIVARSGSKQTNRVSQLAAPTPPGMSIFEIRVQGHLNDRWSDWLEGLEVEYLANGEMILVGPVADQAALLGILNKLGHLNLALLSVNQVERKTKKESK